MDETWEQCCERVRRVVDEAITDAAMSNLAADMGGNAEELGYAVYERLEQLSHRDLTVAIVLLATDHGLVHDRFIRLRLQAEELIA